MKKQFAKSFYNHYLFVLFHMLAVTFTIGILNVQCQSSGANIDPNRQWTGYRGNLASGVLDHANLPDSFNVYDGRNIKWSVEIPGLGLACPIIWGNKVFITSAVSKEDKAGLKTGIFGDVESVAENAVHDWKVFCFDKTNGNLIWEKTAYTGIPKVKRHPKSTHANCTMATDGKNVVAFFGSEGLYCFTMEGQLTWKKDFGLLRSAFFADSAAEWEFASSPVLYDNKVIIQCDVLDKPFIASLDADNGNIIWKADRDDYPTWSTPNIYRNEGRTIVVVNGYKHMGGYDLQTGKEVWRMAGGGDIPIPTPLIGKDLIFLNSAHGPHAPILAIKKNASGDITLAGDQTSNQYVAWSKPRAASYMQTMIEYNGLLYSCSWNGVVTCYDALTGNQIYRQKLSRMASSTASPVIADGKMYIPGDDGTVYIVGTGKTYNLLNTSPLGDVCMTSPAISDGIMIFRTQHSLIAVGKK